MNKTYLYTFYLIKTGLKNIFLVIILDNNTKTAILPAYAKSLPNM